MRAILKVIRGPLTGQTIEVPSGKLLVGRADDCDLHPGSDFVSGYHCVLLLDDYTLRIRDLNSKNGTFVNGRHIGTTPMVLFQHDTISIGEMTVLIDLIAQEPLTPPAELETQPEVSPTAMELTAFCDGETVKVHDPAVSPPPPAVSPPPSTVAVSKEADSTLEIPNVLPSS